MCGTLLFICYNADTTDLIQTNCIMHADDIKIYHRIASQSEKVHQTDIDRLSGT